MLAKLATLATFKFCRRGENGKSAPMSGFYASLSLGYVAKLANLSTWPPSICLATLLGHLGGPSPRPRAI
jgi:hypothetical protein